MDQFPTLKKDILEILVTRAQLKEAVEKLGRTITRDFKGKDLVMICILKGAAIFYSDLIRQIDLPIRTEFMAISSYGSATKTSGVVRILKDLDHDIVGQHVIIVEDIIDTGLTLSFLKKNLEDRGAGSIHIVSLLDKPARRKVDIPIDYSCFSIPDAFVVGYGLDYDEKYRNFPEIGVLHPRVYSQNENSPCSDD